MSGRSSVLKKLVTGATGIGLTLFVIVHLAGNLLLLVGPEAFNEYTHFLESLAHGAFVPVAEVGLAAFFLFHIVAGVSVALRKRRARPSRYAVRGDAGGPSRKTIASRSMILTGAVLAVFVPLHVWMFKLGPGIEAGYSTIIDGEPARDLYALVVDWFQDPLVVAGYVAVMLLLGVHLSHGVWSAFQSLGANNARAMPLLYGAGLVVAAALAVGFLLLPIYLYVFVEPSGAAAMAGLPGGPP